MRNYDGIFEFMPSLIGTIGNASGTALGAPVCVRGFRDVLATLVVGAVYGSGTGATEVLSVKIQECASATGTGATWTDITNGAHLAGSFDFDAVTISGTSPNIQKQAVYEIIDANRKPYIRAHATIAGTAGVSPKVCVSFLLGRPIDSVYIANGSSVTTGNTDYTWNL